MTAHLSSIQHSLLIAALLAGCTGKGGDDDSAITTDTGTTQPAPIPTVVSNDPLAGAVDVVLNGFASATFSEEMDSATFDLADTFTITSGTPAVAVAGSVIYADSTATFWPEAHLAPDTLYTATITTAAQSALGAPLAADHGWSFTTGTLLGPGLPVPLGTAGGFAILAKSGISSVPACVITGDIGVSPAAATYITGFSLSADASNVFSTSPQVTGSVYASDYAPPTPALMTTAVLDMELAFTDAAGRAPDVTELGAGVLSGIDLAPGVYKWGTGVLIPTGISLTGSGTDVWIFEIAQDLTLGTGAEVSLAGGAKAKNVFWQVAGAVELGTTSHLEGVVLTQTAVTMRTGATITGRLLAQTAVDLDSATVTEPAL